MDDTSAESCLHILSGLLVNGEMPQMVSDVIDEVKPELSEALWHVNTCMKANLGPSYWGPAVNRVLSIIRQSMPDSD